MQNRFNVPIVAVACSLAILASSCSDILASNKEPKEKKVEKNSVEAKPESKPATNKSDISLHDIAIDPAEKIIVKKQVPILCYHQVRDYRPTDSKTARDYIVPPAAFQAQMKALAANGFTTILPEQLYGYLAGSAKLPANPVLISFDDGCDEQFDIARDMLKPLNFKAAYFIMTVSINRPNFMSEAQIRQLSEAGHSICLHTWDHHSVKKYQGEDWVTQVEKPKQRLEKIIGKPVDFFAYPFGLWNKEAIAPLKERGLIAAFQLSTARDNSEPLFTIRRIIVPGTWTGNQLVERMESSFK